MSDSLNIAAALRAAAPNADQSVWLPVLVPAFATWSFNTKRRVAAALGQFSVEAGDGFTEIVENMNYSAQGLVKEFPHEFPTIASTAAYVGHPQMIANRAYANKNGNGPESSGDGWLCIGRGLIQISGKDEYNEVAAAFNRTPQQMSIWMTTPDGAVQTACWYLSINKCLPMADAWNLSGITRAVNGAAMDAAEARATNSNAALRAMG